MSDRNKELAARKAVEFVLDGGILLGNEGVVSLPLFSIGPDEVTAPD